MTGKCEDCAKLETCHKDIGIIWGFCNTDFQPKEEQDMEKYEGWAMLSCDCKVADDIPDSFTFDVCGVCASEARENARKMCHAALEQYGLQAEIVSTNMYEVAGVLPDGTELVYIVDVN